MPQLEYFDAEAFAELQKTFRECSEKRGMFKEFAERMMQEDAALAALATAPGNLLGQVSALGGHSDEVAGDAMIRMAGENAKASEKFRDMIDRGEVDWLLLRPVWSDLLNGGNGGRWTSATARGFIDADFKKRKEEEERKALLQTAATVGVAAVTLLAMATPLGPIGAAFFIAVDALTVASSVAEASAAAKKAEVTGAGAAAGVISKDDASRAKEEADAKQSGMVFDIVFAALPYVGHVAKGAGKAAGAIGRSARWAKAARGAEEMKNLGNLQKTTKEVTAADQAINKISGIPDAKDSGVFHELKYGPHGPERCTHCELFGNSLSDRGKFVQKTAGATDRLKTRTMYIQARANSISARAREIEKLPEAARRTKESALLREAYELEMHMVEIEHEALGITSGRLPAQHKGRWSNPETPGTGIWYPNEGHPAFAYCGTKGIPYHNGYPQFSTLALKGGEVNLLPGQKVLIGGSQRDVGMVGKMSDFEVADAMAAQMTGMKDATAFREWRLDKGFTWHHRENGVTMQLVPTALHASIPHIGGASFQRGIPVK
jgi:hypothetical protein